MIFGRNILQSITPPCTKTLFFIARILLQIYHLFTYNPINTLIPAHYIPNYKYIVKI